MRLISSFCLEALAKTEASQIVELAVALPILLLLVVGITDFGSAFNTRFKIANAVREGARFAANESEADLSYSLPPPPSISAVRDVVDTYLVSAKLSDCGPSTAIPFNSGLVWRYTVSGCPGTLTLVINRGSTFLTTGSTPITVEATDVNIQYPYHWQAYGVVRFLFPTSTTIISADAVMQNLD